MGFFFSLQQYSTKSYESLVALQLLDNKLTKKTFKNWEKIRDIILGCFNLKNKPNCLLNELFMTDSEIQYTADCLNPGLAEATLAWKSDMIKDIKNMRREIKCGNSEMKQSLEHRSKLFKVGKTTASAIAWYYLQSFIKKDLDEQQKILEEEKEEVKDPKENVGNIQDQDILELDSEGEILDIDNIEEDDDRVNGNIETLKNTKNAYIEEFQMIQKEINDKRQAIIQILGLTKSLDPLFVTTKEKVEKARKKIKGFRDNVKGEENQRFMFRAYRRLGQMFFDRGSRLSTDNFKKIKRKIDRIDLLKSRDVVHRSGGYNTKMSTYQIIWRVLIHHDKELFRKTIVNSKERMFETLANIQKGIKQEKIKNEDYDTTKEEIYNKKRNSIYLENEIDEIITDEVDQNFEKLKEKIIGKKKEKENKEEEEEKKEKKEENKEQEEDKNNEEDKENKEEEEKKDKKEENKEQEEDKNNEEEDKEKKNNGNKDKKNQELVDNDSNEKDSKTKKEDKIENNEKSGEVNEENIDKNNEDDIEVINDDQINQKPDDLINNEDDKASDDTYYGVKSIDESDDKKLDISDLQPVNKDEADYLQG